MTGDRTISLSDAEEAYQAAKALPPDERLRLALRLWGSLPPDYWAAPTPADLAEAYSRINEFDARGFADSPWEIILHSLAYRRSGKRPSKIYSAPRRFDLATIFVVMAAFSILLGVMSLLSFPPVISLVIAGFVTLVGISQALLFRAPRPGLASLLAGLVCIVLPILVAIVLSSPAGISFLAFTAAILEGLILGPLLGYVAGVFVGGTFLLADLFRKAFQRRGAVENDNRSELDE